MTGRCPINRDDISQQSRLTDDNLVEMTPPDGNTSGNSAAAIGRCRLGAEKCSTPCDCHRNTAFTSGVIYRHASDDDSIDKSEISNGSQDDDETGNNDVESVCFTTHRRQIVGNRRMRKSVRKYYNKQKSLIDAYEQLRSNAGESSDDGKTMKLASFWSKVTFAINFALLVAKIIAAVLSGSLVVISSMLDSAMDLVSGGLMWWSNRVIKKTNYYFYPRGRRKLESVAIVVLAVIMSFVSVQVIQESIQKIVIYLTHVYDSELAAVSQWLRDARAVDGLDTDYYNSTTVSGAGAVLNLSSTINLVAALEQTLGICASQHGAPVFETPTIVICVTTIVTKLVLYLICRRIQNHSVQALAKDHFNDVISNTGAVACGIIGYRLWKYADPIGAIIISISIIINWSITTHSQIKMLNGYTARPDFLKKITWIALRHDDRIRCIERVIAFHFGSRYLVEVHIVLPAEMSMRVAHDLSKALQTKIERLSEVERAFVLTDYFCDWLNREPAASVAVTTDVTETNLGDATADDSIIDNDNDKI